MLRSQSTLLSAILVWGIAIGYAHGQSGTPLVAAVEPDATSESLAKVLKWMGNQQVRYQVPMLYETGDSDTVFKQPPANAWSLRSFELPLQHTHYEYLGKYGRAYLYDVALATVLWSAVGEFGNAKGLLTTLQHLQNDDGSIGFSWNSFGDGFVNTRYARTGSCSWAGLAGTAYERLSGDQTFRKFTERMADYVLSQQVKDPGDLRYGFVKGGHGYWSAGYTKMERRPAEWCCMEHQIDSYFFLRDLYVLTREPRYLEATTLLRRQMMDVLWDDQTGHFHAAVDSEGVNRDLALDASSWGCIFLRAIGESEKASRALAFVDETFQSCTGGVAGYKAYAGEYRDHPADWTKPNIMVWSEGSLGVAAAYLKLGDRVRSEKIVTEIIKMQRPGGGVCYTTYSDDLASSSRNVETGGETVEPTDPLDDFLRCPSTAGSAWLALVVFEQLNDCEVFWGPDPAEFPAYRRADDSRSPSIPAPTEKTAIAILERGEAAGRIGTFVGRGGKAASRRVGSPAAAESGQSYCEVACDNSQGGFCGWYVDFLDNPIDAGAAVSLEIVIRGLAGGERLKTGLKDATMGGNADAITVNLPPLSKAWQTLAVPLASFAKLDKTQIASFVLMPDRLGTSAFCVRSIRLTDGDSARTLDFAGCAWRVKSGPRMGPGPNNWTDAENAAWMDSKGVHLTISQEEDTWQSTEILTKSQGYGEYVFIIEGDLSNIDPNAVFGAFLYRTDTEECDFELSRWGVAESPNSQFCVQPAAADSLYRFDAGDARELTVKLTWAPRRFRGRCWVGASTSREPIADWTYVGEKVPRFGAGEAPMNVHLNFWLFRGAAPISRSRQEILVKSFTFKPAK